MSSTCFRAAGKLILLCAFLSGAHAALCQRPALQGAWVWHERWTSAPKDVNPDLRYAGAIILYLGEDGNFTRWSGTLYSQNHHLPTISAGDSETLSAGSWMPIPHGVRLTMRKFYSDVIMNHETFPGPTQVAETQLRGKVLIFDRLSYRRAPNLDQQMIPFEDQARKTGVLGPHPPAH